MTRRPRGYYHGLNYLQETDRKRSQLRTEGRAKVWTYFIQFAELIICRRALLQELTCHVAACSSLDKMRLCISISNLSVPKLLESGRLPKHLSVRRRRDRRNRWRRQRVIRAPFIERRSYYLSHAVSLCVTAFTEETKAQCGHFLLTHTPFQVLRRNGITGYARQRQHRQKKSSLPPPRHTFIYIQTINPTTSLPCYSPISKYDCLGLFRIYWIPLGYNMILDWIDDRIRYNGLTVCK